MKSHESDREIGSIPDLCPDSEEITLYLQGLLPGERWEAVEQHVLDCEQCAPLMGLLSRTADELDRALRTLSGSTDRDQIGVTLKFEEFSRLPPRRERPAVETQFPVRFGDYVCVRELGRGGMGTIYQAYDFNRRRWVAMKSMRLEVSRQAEILHRFQREAQALATLNHPHIVSANGLEILDDRHFLILEYVRGETVASLLRRVGALPWRLASVVACHIARALAHTHSHGMTHRDIKPSNIIVRENGQAVVLDFGLVRLLESIGEPSTLTLPGEILGTLEYMAPEQLSETAIIDCRADFFSLGLTLYHLLTGERELTNSPSPHLSQRLAAILRAPIVDRSRFAEGVPLSVVELCENLTKQNPDDRPQSAEQIVAVLESITSADDERALAAIIRVPEAMEIPPRSAGAAPSDTTGSPPGALPSANATRGGNRWGVGKILAGTAGSLFLAFIIILIQDRQGRTVGQLEVKPGQSLVIQGDAESLNTTQEMTLEEFLTAVFANGGSITVQPPEPAEPLLIRSLIELPPLPYEVIGVDLSKSVRVTNAFLKSLPIVPALTNLNLSDTNVTDEGLTYVAQATGLVELNLHRTSISDSGMKDLVKLSKLRRLYVDGNNLTDRGIQQLAALQSLRFLMIGGTACSDDGVKAIADLTRLQNLGIQYTQVTAEGISHLVQKRPLNFLDVSGLDLTEEACHALGQMRTLKTLVLNDAAITSENLAALRGALPTCHFLTNNQDRK